MHAYIHQGQSHSRYVHKTCPVNLECSLPTYLTAEGCQAEMKCNVFVPRTWILKLLSLEGIYEHIHVLYDNQCETKFIATLVTMNCLGTKRQIKHLSWHKICSTTIILHKCSITVDLTDFRSVHNLRIAAMFLMLSSILLPTMVQVMNRKLTWRKLVVWVACLRERVMHVYVTSLCSKAKLCKSGVLQGELQTGLTSQVRKPRAAIVLHVHVPDSWIVIVLRPIVYYSVTTCSWITFSNHIQYSCSYSRSHALRVQMDPTPFSAALITAGEFSRKSTKDASIWKWREAGPQDYNTRG